MHYSAGPTGMDFSRHGRVWGTKVWLGNLLAENMDERGSLNKTATGEGGGAEVAFST